MQVLLIDNFDSFTFNLARYFEELDCAVSVCRNNEVSLNDVERANPDLIVISPGPCTPDESGISLEVIENLQGKIPLFGVCLGHQAIAQVLGAKVVRAKKVMHGKVSVVSHFRHKMFQHIPANFEVTRYHSLLVAQSSFPEELIVTAISETEVSEGQEVMAFAHETVPLWGVQFHPESHLTQYGHKLLKNIIDLAAAFNAVQK